MFDRLAEWESRLGFIARRHWSYRVERLPGGPACWRVRVPARGRELARVFVATGAPALEPAAVEAALRLLEAGAVPPGVALDTLPIAAGDPPAAELARLVDGTRYALFVDLREDARLGGAYVVEPDGRGLGVAIAGEWRRIGLPLARAGELRRGLAVAGARVGDGWCAGALRDGPSLAMLVRQRSAERALALETPVQADWEQRVRGHLLGLRAAFAAVAGHHGFSEFASQRGVVPFRPGWQP